MITDSESIFKFSIIEVLMLVSTMHWIKLSYEKYLWKGKKKTISLWGL